MAKFTPKFEAWYARADTYMGGTANLNNWHYARLKCIAFNAWKAALRTQEKPIEIVDGLDGRAASNRGEQAGEREPTCPNSLSGEHKWHDGICKNAGKPRSCVHCGYTPALFKNQAE